MAARPTSSTDGAPSPNDGGAAALVAGAQGAVWLSVDGEIEIRPRSLHKIVGTETADVANNEALLQRTASSSRAPPLGTTAVSLAGLRSSVEIAARKSGGRLVALFLVCYGQEVE